MYYYYYYYSYYWYYYLYIPAQIVMRTILENICRISEHGVFPLVSVWVRHGEPGNMHPYNFETISFAKAYFFLGIGKNLL